LGDNVEIDFTEIRVSHEMGSGWNWLKNVLNTFRWDIEY